MTQEGLKMISSAVSSSLNSSLSIGKQVASGSRSSILLSHIDFTQSDSEQSLTTQNLQSKYFHLGSGLKNSKEATFNGHVKSDNAVYSQKSGKLATVNGMHESSAKNDGIPVPKVQLYPVDKVNVEWQQVQKIGAGLVNLGNTCFMNTVIQCLTYCPPLANYLLHDDDHVSKCKIVNFCMMCELHKHIKRALDRQGEVIKPLYIYQKLKLIAKHFQFGRQEDAHEFLRYVIDNLWKAALANYEGSVKLDPASKETTVINQIFGGYHRSQVICLKCKEKSNTYDHFMDFILDIKNISSLEKALEKFVQPELLQNENAYKCPKCNMKVPAHKKFSVHRAPNVATFQFKRFDYNRMMGGKIVKHITYPEKLDLRPYMSEKQGSPVLYRLNAVLVHLGPSCNSGHYFCYVKNSNGFWYLMDDARVHQVSLNQVLNQPAYVLFYVRVPYSSSVKKSTSLTLNNKTPEGIRNGHVVSALLPHPGNPPKSPSTPAMMSSLPSSPVLNGHTNGVIHNRKQSLPLLPNRSKISFGIKRPVPSSSNESPAASPVKKEPSFCASSASSSTSLSTASTTRVSETIVNSPHVKKSSNSLSACLVPYAGDSSDTDEDQKSSKGSLESGLVNDQKNAEGTSSEILASSDSKSQPSDKPKLSLSCRTAADNAATSKVKSTSVFLVSDANLRSPSVASESSTNSVNSTTDWNVTDNQEAKRKNGERSYLGWTVKPEVDNSDKKDCDSKSSSDSDSKRKLNSIEDLNHSPKISAGVSKSQHDQGKQLSTSGNSPEINCRRDYSQSDQEHKFQETKSDRKQSFLQSAKEVVSSKKSNGNREGGGGNTGDGFRRSPEALASGELPHNRPAYPGVQRDQSEPVLSTEKSSGALHEKHQSSPFSKSAVFKSPQFEGRESEKRKERRDHYSSEYGYHHSADSSWRGKKDHESYNGWGNSKKFKGSDQSVSENGYSERFREKDRGYSRRSSPDLGNGYEVEWVEKTKESLEAEKHERRASYPACVKHWDSGIKDGYSKSENRQDSGYAQWNGSKSNNEVNRFFQQSSFRGYGNKVHSWDGSLNNVDRSIQDDHANKRKSYNYDDDYDKGKKQKFHKHDSRYGNHRSFNAFQNMQNIRNNRGKYYSKDKFYSHHRHRSHEDWHHRPHQKFYKR